MKYCPKCGHELNDDARYCAECGYKLVDDYFEGNYQNYNHNSSQTGGYLGIISIVLAFLIPIAGLIISIIGLKSGDEYERKTSKIGLILSIIILCLRAFSVILSLLFFGLLSSALVLF